MDVRMKNGITIRKPGFARKLLFQIVESSCKPQNPIP